jgi:hypothetical protein
LNEIAYEAAHPRASIIKLTSILLQRKMKMQGAIRQARLLEERD